MKLVYGLFLLLSLCGLPVLAGCSSDPDENDGRRQKEDNCNLHIGACRNNCNRLALGRSCTRCCDKMGSRCLGDGDPNFSECTRWRKCCALAQRVPTFLLIIQC